MPTTISFLRGINVGGKNILPMKALSALFEQAGATQVKTYIQSGNVVFALDKNTSLQQLETAVAAQIQTQFGFTPAMLIITLDALEQAIAHNPYAADQPDPACMHFGFLAQTAPNADHAKMQNLRSDSERYTVIDTTFYLHAPDEIGRSKLAANAERCLGVAMTMRNLKTVTQVLELARVVR